MFHSDNLKKGSKVINVEVFQSSHCQSVSKRQPKKGKCFKTAIVKVSHSDNLKKSSKVIIVEVFQNSHCQSVSK